jgi:pectate lyase
MLMALAAISSLHGQTGTALVRHAPDIKGAVAGSIQVASGETFTVASNAAIAGDLLVPGTPTVQVQSNAQYAGTIDGSGAIDPTGYSIVVSSHASLGKIIRRTDATTLPSVSAPPASGGVRTVVLDRANQNAGDFATVANLTLKNNTGAIAVPPGTYGNFNASSNSGLVLGVTGALAPAVYNFQSLTLNSDTTVQVVGPVVVTVNGGLALASNITLGAAEHPEWLQLRVAAGGLTVGSHSAVYAYIDAPAGAVSLSSGSQISGGVRSDRLLVDSNATLDLRLNAAPSIALTAPADGTVVTAPATLVLRASASDADGVAKVEFLLGSTVIGTATAAPYQFTLSNVAPGTYSFSARATDYLGASTTSAAATVIVNAAPTIALTAPSSGSVFTAPASQITLAADAADADGTIAKVDFYRGATLIGTAATAPFSLDWNNVAAGTYVLTAIATDNRGASTTSAPVSIVVNAPPTIALTSPSDGVVFNAPAAFVFSANAADSDGLVAQVDFYRNGALLGSATSAPYALNVSNLTAGEYTFTAVATDNLGATATSADVSIVVNAPPAVALTAPSTGTSLAAPAAVGLAATATDSDGVITKVEFFQNGTLVGSATTAPYQLSLSGLAVGNYSFTAMATDDSGAVTSSAPVDVTVHINQAPSVALTAPANNGTFTAPAAIALTATASDADGSVARVDFYQGTTLLGSVTAPPYQFNWTSVPTGSYQLTAIATDNLGATRTSTAVTITVSDPAPATIVFDSASSGASTVATTSLTWTHTLTAGADNRRGLLVGIATRGSTAAAATPSGVTFAGVPMVALPASVAVAGTSTINRTQLYYLLDASLPAVGGTYNIVATFATSQSSGNNPIGGAIALTNVSQAAPSAFANSNGATTTNNLSTTLTSLTTGAWVADIFAAGSTSANIQTNNAAMVQRFIVPQSGGLPNSDAAGSTQVVGSTGTVTMAWKSATAREAQSLAVFTPAVTVQAPPNIPNPIASQTAAVGANVAFTVAATGTAPLSYQWFKDGAPIAGATALTLNLANVQTSDSGNYSVLVTNAVGSATSNAAALTVNVIAPTITNGPVALAVNAGDPASFSVTATGTAPLSYQWQKNGTAIPGATASTFAIASAQAGDAGTYAVTVSNAASSVTSSGVSLSVNTGPVAPTIAVQPLPQNVGVGQSAAFSVSATGTAPLSYQWRKNGADITGANAATFTIGSAQVTDAGSYTVLVSNTVGTALSNPVALTVNPLTSPAAIYNLTGFATVGAGTTGGGIVAESDPTYAKVFTPLDLATAIMKANKTAGAVKVIEIMNDLDLGWNEIGSAVQTLGSTPFRANAAPKIHPVLLQTGVSKIDITPKSGLTIFSANGSTIRHTSFNIKGTSNVIVRNLKFDELWEWDEATKGNYDSNDWDFITLANGGAVSNVWIDHCTFTKAYDGIVDLKAGASNVTFSWCRYVGDDGATNPNSWVRRQFAALEANISAYPMYNFFRSRGFSVEDMVAVAQGHDKTHLMGSNSLDAANATLTATFHHQWFVNCWDRCVPRLRAGNVHNYDIYVDDTGVLAARRLRDARVALMTSANQNTANNTYSMRPPVNGSISTEGGAVLLEKSVYIDCLTPLRNNQTDPSDPQYTGKILALDSIYHFDNSDGSTVDARGNSTDSGNPFGPFQAPVIPFSWNLPNNQLPYAYTLDDPASLLSLLQAGAGAGAISWSKENWLKTSY